VTITHGKTAYEKANFFDALNLVTNETRVEEVRKNKNQATGVNLSSENLEDQRLLDAQTFGSVAEQYRFASNMRNKGQYHRGFRNMNTNYGDYQHTGNFQYGNKPYVVNTYHAQQQMSLDGGQRIGRDQNRYYMNTGKEPNQQRQQHRMQRSTWQPRQ